jgi:thiol-disulfide isomerase/thioredoxin
MSVSRVISVLVGLASAFGCVTACREADEPPRSVQALPVTVNLPPQPPTPPPPPVQEPPPPSDPVATRPWLGIEMAEGDGGVRVASVFSGSPAEAAGMKDGDLLHAVAGQSVASPTDVLRVLGRHQPGEDLPVAITRGNQRLDLIVRVTSRPDSTALLESLYIGKPAPSLSTLRTVAGSVVPSLVQLRGQVVVVEFWATWCVACRLLSPHLNQWFDEYSARGVRIIAVSSEPFEEVTRELPNLDIHYPVFVDESTDVSRAYHAAALPTLFLIDREGVVRAVRIGYSPEQVTELRTEIEGLIAIPSVAPSGQQ